MNCNDQDDLDLFCASNTGNSISFGNSFGASTSNILNVRMASDQEINQLVNCEQMLGSCQVNAENVVGLGTVLSADIGIRQKSDQELRCNDKNNTFCNQSTDSEVSIGGPTDIATVSNLELNLDQNQHQEMDCSEGSEFGVCSNGGIEQVRIGDIPTSGEGTVAVDNLKADLTQIVNQDAVCGEATVFFCGNVAANRIILSESSGGFFDIFDNSSISNIDIYVAQSTFQENICNGGEGVSCSNGINENEVNIAGDRYCYDCQKLHSIWFGC